MSQVQVSMPENSSYGDATRDIEYFAEKIVPDRATVLKYTEEFSNLSREERYDETWKLFFEMMKESGEEDIGELIEEIKDKPSIDVMRELKRQVSYMKSSLMGIIREARESMERDIETEELLIDKFLEEYHRSLTAYIDFLEEEDRENALKALNLNYIVFFRLIELSQMELERDVLIEEVLLMSRELKKLGYEHEDSQKILSGIYSELESENYDKVLNHVKFERAVIIHRSINMSVKRAAEITGLKLGEFMELAREYDVGIEMK